MGRRSDWTGRRAELLIEVHLPSVTRWGTPAGESAYFVEPKHEAELRRFVADVVRSARPALIANIVGGVLASWGAPRADPTGRWLHLTGLALLGIGISIFPFTHLVVPRAFGIRRSRGLDRLVGAGMVVYAAAKAVVYAWMG